MSCWDHLKPLDMAGRIYSDLVSPELGPFSQAVDKVRKSSNKRSHLSQGLHNPQTRVIRPLSMGSSLKSTDNTLTDLHKQLSSHQGTIMCLASSYEQWKKCLFFYYTSQSWTMKRLPLSHLFSSDVWLALGQSIMCWMILTEWRHDFPSVTGPRLWYLSVSSDMLSLAGALGPKHRYWSCQHWWS